MKTNSSLFLALSLLTGTAASATQPAAPAELIARGKYLVENVAMCADCHSTRNERGEFVKEFWLKGAALPFAPTVPMPVFANVAPTIAGLPTLPADADAEKFLMTGLKPDGSRSRPPMPEFRLDEKDAKAMVAYLRSLAAPESTPVATK